MVYINTFNAVFTVVIITLVSAFIIFTAHLWNENLKMRAEQKIEETVSGMKNNKDCLSLISYYDGKAVLYNECGFNPEINLYINSEVMNYSRIDEDSVITLNFDNRTIESLRIIYENGRIVK